MGVQEEACLNAGQARLRVSSSRLLNAAGWLTVLCTRTDLGLSQCFRTCWEGGLKGSLLPVSCPLAFLWAQSTAQGSSKMMNEQTSEPMHGCRTQNHLGRKGLRVQDSSTRQAPSGPTDWCCLEGNCPGLNDCGVSRSPRSQPSACPATSCSAPGRSSWVFGTPGQVA